MNLYLSLGIIFLSALLVRNFLRKVKFPDVTAYLLLGILIGPYFFKWVAPQLLNSLGFYTNLVLGIVAFSLGENFSRNNLRKLGKSVLMISIGEVVVSWGLVTACLYFFLHQPLYIALLFGAIAPATAPMATVMIIKQYRARGEMTNTILGVVAIDDAWGLILFALSLAVAKGIFFHTSSSALGGVAAKAFLEVIGAVGLGIIVGVFFSFFAKFSRTRESLSILTIGAVILTIGISMHFSLSVLLSEMALGTTLVNFNHNSSKSFDEIRNIDFFFYLVFFVLTGASLDILSLKTLGILGGVYFITRPLGEWIGAYLGAFISKAKKLVRNYIGLSLVPQAGVALGMAVLCKTVFPEAGVIVLNVIIATTILYEIIGPFATRFVLRKAGEIKET